MVIFLIPSHGLALLRLHSAHERLLSRNTLIFFFPMKAEVFLGTGFFELRGGEMFFGQKKISRASREDPGEASLWGFWNPSALWWGQFDEMGKFLLWSKWV